MKKGRLNDLRPRQAGFTLAEGVFAVTVLSMFVLACFAAITFSRVAAAKAKEQAIATDFLVHYSELIRALPFEAVVVGNPINPLLDGSGEAPDIRIPADGSWVSLDTEDFEVFHPDLLWIHNRNPRMRVLLTSKSVGGGPHTQHLNVRVAWDAPLHRGGRLEQRADLVRVKDL